MIIDLGVDSVNQSSFSANVCIFGGGPAGITLALELARARPDWQILLAEAGGPDSAAAREREIYEASSGPLEYSVLRVSRRRKLGGASAHRGSWSKPLNDSDYRDNPRWDLPAWPFDASEMAPYMQKAVDWAEIQSSDFGMQDVRSRLADKLLPLPADSALSEQLFRFREPLKNS